MAALVLIDLKVNGERTKAAAQGGYANATEIAAEAHLSGRGVAEIVLERKLMSPAQLADVLRPEVLTKPQMIPTHAV